METVHRKRARIWAYLMLAFFILLTGMAFPLSAFAGNTVVVACSDYQYPNWDTYEVGGIGNAGGAIVAGNTAQKLLEAGVSGVDALLCAGDYDFDLNRNADDTAAGIISLRNALNTSGLTDSHTHWVLVQGNHDPRNTGGGTSATGNNDPASGAYGVYVLNERDYPWYGGTEAGVKAAASDLQTYLDDKLDKKFSAPIFVISHLPLHYSMRTWVEGDARYAKYIFDVLNNYSAHGLNIIYLFGHDHSQGWDDYLGGSKVFLAPGDRINIADGTETGYTSQELKFVYMNAGFMGYYKNHNTQTSALDEPFYDIKDLTMSCFVISDNSVRITRYCCTGPTELKKAGILNRYRQEDTLQNYSPNMKVVSGTYVRTGGTIGHAYGSWTTEKEPTYTAEGLEKRVCAYDSSHVETRTIAKLPKPAPETEAKPASGTQTETEAKPASGTQTETEAKPASGTQAETEAKPASGTKTETKTKPSSGTKTETKTAPESDTKTETKVVPQSDTPAATASDADPKGAEFGVLQAKAVKVSTKTIKVQWRKVKGADSYIIYGNRCGKKLKKLATVKGTSYTQKKLKKGTYYKYVVVAVSSGRTISTSKMVHTVTKGGRYGNAVSLTVSKKKVTVKIGRTYKVKTKVKNDKTANKHRAVAFESGNTKIATVTGKGTIKGVGKGTCSIYVYAQNGLMKKIQVTVK